MKSEPPANSRVLPLIAGSYFYDAWSVEAGNPALSAMAQFLKAVEATPAWVARCMDLRNKVVEKLGLKNLGGMDLVDKGKAPEAYQRGDRVGIFTFLEQTCDEVLLGDSDKHLDVTLSVHRQELSPGCVRVTVTTVVHVHNWLGRLYLLPVTPMHKLIVPAMLRAVAQP